MDRYFRLFASAVSRLLRIYGNGDWDSAPIWLDSTREFSAALPRQRPSGVLAALAYLPVEVHPRLHLHSYGGQPQPSPALHASDLGKHGNLRTLARSRMDFCILGALARSWTNHLSWMAIIKQAIAERGLGWLLTMTFVLVG